jgi:hypothetical protein
MKVYGRISRSLKTHSTHAILHSQNSRRRSRTALEQERPHYHQGEGSINQPTTTEPRMGCHSTQDGYYHSGDPSASFYFDSSNLGRAPVSFELFCAGWTTPLLNLLLLVLDKLGMMRPTTFLRLTDHEYRSEFAPFPYHRRTDRTMGINMASEKPHRLTLQSKPGLRRPCRPLPWIPLRAPFSVDARCSPQCPYH